MTELILIALLALGLGLLVGWLGAARRGHALATELAAARVRADHADLQRSMLAAVTIERDEARSLLAAERSAATERTAGFQARLDELIAAKEALGSQFAEVGAKLLDEAQTRFLQRADARFKESERLSGEKLGALLQPVSERLLRYEEGVAKVEAERRDAFGTLHGLIQSMRDGQEGVRAEAAKLVNALRAAPKARGRWGEQQLRNVLETCGLAEHTDFRTEVSVISSGEEGGRLRPDAIIRVPGGRSLVIDAKVSLNAYQDAHGAGEESERARHMALHVTSMKAHVNGLGAKAYWSQFEDTPDYVIMFVPGEHFLAAALEHDPTLWDYAFDRKVLLATPTNLIAIARTVAAVWRQEKLASEAKAIGALGKELYERLAKLTGDLRKVGGGLTSAVNNYNAFVASFEGRALVTARKFRDLNIEPGAKDIEDVPPVEALARYTAPALVEVAQAAE